MCPPITVLDPPPGVVGGDEVDGGVVEVDVEVEVVPPDEVVGLVVCRMGGTENGSRPEKFCTGGTVGWTEGVPVWLPVANRSGR